MGQQIQTLISAGLVSGPRPVPVEKGTKASIWSQPGVRYDLTELGQKYKAVVTSFLFKPQTELCYAHAEITGVDSFTEPAPFLGQIMTTVSYEYRLVDVAPWALQPAIVQAFHLEHNLELRNHTEKGKIALSQTSEGWREVQ